MVSYTEGEDAFDVFVATPECPGPRPTVVICHAWGGRDDFAEGKAQSLAELGYIGAAIDLYGKGKRGLDKASSEALMMSVVREPEVLRRRLRRAFDVVRGLDGVDAGRMGTIGYCFGGLCSITMARMGLPLRGAVSFHGLLKVDGEPRERVQARVLVLHGQDDPLVPPSDVGAFVEDMKRLDVDWELHVYPRVMHAFTNPKANDADFGTVYDKGADARSWNSMRRFFEDVFA